MCQPLAELQRPLPFGLELCEGIVDERRGPRLGRSRRRGPFSLERAGLMVVFRLASRNSGPAAFVFSRVLSALVARQRTDHEVDVAPDELGREVGMAAFRGDRNPPSVHVRDDALAESGARRNQRARVVRIAPRQQHLDGAVTLGHDTDQYVVVDPDELEKMRSEDAKAITDYAGRAKLVGEHTFGRAAVSKTLPLPKVQNLVDTRIAQKLSQLPGVGLVSLSGGQRPGVCQ